MVKTSKSKKNDNNNSKNNNANTNNNANNANNLNNNNSNNNNSNNNNLNNNNLNNNNLNNNLNNNNLNNNNLNNNNLNNNLNNNNLNKNYNDLTNNEKINKFVNESKKKLLEAKKFSDNFKNQLNKMPFQLKAFNIVICLIFTYVFTHSYYNFWFSLIFAIMTSMFIYLYVGFYFSIIFFVMYLIVLTKIINQKNITKGIIIKQTDIYNTSNKKAFQCDAPQTPQNNIVPASDFRTEIDNRDFTISLFLYVNGTNPTYTNNFFNYRYRDWKSIFYLGNREIKENSESSPEQIQNLYQLPGLWLKPTLNNIVCVIKDGQTNNRMELNDIPLNEWFSITIVMNSASVSLYKNCKLEKIINLRNVIPDTSEYNLYLANDGKLIKYNDDKTKNGFAGQMAYFTYYSYILTQKQISDYCEKYKNILAKYQNNQNKNITYETSCLVTDSDTTSL